MIRKFICVAAVAAIFLSAATNAQVRQYQLKDASEDYFEAGVRAGANMQQISAFPFVDGYNPGAFAGGYAKRRNQLFGVELEANLGMTQFKSVYPVGHQFSLGGDVFTDTTTKSAFNMMYLNIPLMFEVRLAKPFAFQLGAQYSMLISNGEKNGVFAKRYGTEDIFNKTNLSLLAGFELNICKDLRLGARYAMGMTDLNNGKYIPFKDRWYTNSGQLYLTYRLTKWGVKY